MAALKEKGLYKYTGDMDLTGKSKALYRDLWGEG